MFSVMGLGQENQLRMCQNVSQSILFQKFSGGACFRTPLKWGVLCTPILTRPCHFSTCSYSSKLSAFLLEYITMEKWECVQKVTWHSLGCTWSIMTFVQSFVIFLHAQKYKQSRTMWVYVDWYVTVQSWVLCSRFHLQYMIRMILDN